MQLDIAASSKATIDEHKVGHEPLNWSETKKDKRGFDPNFEAMESPCDMFVQTVGPCNHRTVYLSKCCGGYC